MSRINALRSGKRLADPAAIALKALDLLQPPERIPTVDCAEKYRLMPGQENGAVIRYDRMRTPYNVGPMNSLDKPRCHGIVMVKPSRSGGTAVAENYAFKLMKFGPMTWISWFLNNDEAVTDYVRNVVRAGSKGNVVQLSVVQDTMDAEGKVVTLGKTITIQSLSPKKGTFRITPKR